MKNFLLVLLFGLITLPSMAESPKLHAFGGYQYFRDGSGSGNNLNGIEGAFWVDAAKHVGVAADISTAVKSVNPMTLRMTTYTFGPVVSMNSRATVNPFAHVLIGGAKASSSFDQPYSYLNSSVNYFALKTGGGVDVKVSRLLSVRGIQFDWNYLRGNHTSFKDELSVATGVVFNF